MLLQLLLIGVKSAFAGPRTFYCNLITSCLDLLDLASRWDSTTAWKGLVICEDYNMLFLAHHVPSMVEAVSRGPCVIKPFTGQALKA